MWAKGLIAVAVGFGLLLLPFSSAGQSKSRSSALQQTRPQVTGGSGGDIRKLRKPPDPEAVALLIHLLDRFASDVPDKTELDKRVEQRLSQNGVTRESARRMMANFRKISLAERRAVLGQWADIPARERIAESRYRAAFERAAQAAGRLRHPVSTDSHPPNPSTRQSPKQLRPARKPQPRGWLKPLDTPEALPTGFRQSPESRDWEMPWVRRISYSPVLAFQEQPYPRYLLWYEGLWCHEETYADNTNDNDQIYIITTVTDAHGNITAKFHPWPYDTDTYEDLNAGDHRTGPRSRVSGNGVGRRGRSISGLPAQDLTLSVGVFEHDMAPIDDGERVLAGLTGLLGAACAAGGNPGVCAAAAVGLLVTFTYHVLTGGSDDLISVETVTIADSEVARMANEEPRVKLGAIPYHFSTIHQGGDFDIGDAFDGSAGADYHVYFTIRLVPPPPVAQPGS